MDDPTAIDVPQEKKDEIIREVMALMDHNSDGIIDKHEWLEFTGEGRKGTLPDFGLGPGHHWDMETEYEIHHWEKYQSVPPQILSCSSYQCLLCAVMRIPRRRI